MSRAIKPAAWSLHNPLEKAGRVGERLSGMAGDVWSYATGERGAKRARHGLEQAGAEFERAAALVVARLNGIEAHREQERAAQHQKALELERSQRQRCDQQML